MTVEIRDTDRVFRLKKWQAGFIKTEARYPANVSAWGTGKSLSLIARAMRLSEGYPNNLGVVFRKEYTDLRDSTIKDFESYTGLKVNSQREVKLGNGSIIMFRHLEEMNNIQNMNLGWFAIEQAEELETDDQFFVLFGRLRRANVPHSGFIVANTNGHNWIYKLWKIKNLEGGELYEATTYDNKDNLDPKFLESLEVLKEKKPKLYNRLVLNSWDESDTIDIIIQPSWVEAATKRELSKVHPVRSIVSIDVARYGDDKTVFYAIANNEVIGRQEFEKKSTMEIVGYAMRFAKEYQVRHFAVDEIGVGAGVVDRLKELGCTVIPVNSSERSITPENFYNLRAEIYSRGADAFESGRVKIQADDRDLIEQLSWAKYKTIKSNGVYQVEAKEDIKKRYGRSPDNADCFLNGLWALSRVSARPIPYIEAKRMFG